MIFLLKNSPTWKLSIIDRIIEEYFCTSKTANFLNISEKDKYCT